MGGGVAKDAGIDIVDQYLAAVNALRKIQIIPRTDQHLACAPDAFQTLTDRFAQ
jgi:hypothetical protein